MLGNYPVSESSSSVCYRLCLGVGSVSHASGRPHASPTPDLVHLTLRQRSNAPISGRRRTTAERYRSLLSGVDDSRVWEQVEGRRRCSFVIRAVLTASEWPLNALPEHHLASALRCAATRHTAQRRAPDINEALSSR